MPKGGGILGSILEALGRTRTATTGRGPSLGQSWKWFMDPNKVGPSIARKAVGYPLGAAALTGSIYGASRLAAPSYRKDILEPQVASFLTGPVGQKLTTAFNEVVNLKEDIRTGLIQLDEETVRRIDDTEKRIRTLTNEIRSGVTGDVEAMRGGVRSDIEDLSQGVQALKSDVGEVIAKAEKLKGGTDLTGGLAKAKQTVGLGEQTRSLLTGAQEYGPPVGYGAMAGGMLGLAPSILSGLGIGDEEEKRKSWMARNPLKAALLGSALGGAGGFLFKKFQPNIGSALSSLGGTPSVATAGGGLQKQQAYNIGLVLGQEAYREYSRTSA